MSPARADGVVRQAGQTPRDTPRGKQATPGAPRGEQATHDTPRGKQATPGAPRGEQATHDTPRGKQATPDTPHGKQGTQDAPHGKQATPDTPRGKQAAQDTPRRKQGARPRERRVRRHDPDRKDRIVDAAIRVIAEHGVAGTTHRLIAAEADVPLGSLTYHFTGLDDLRVQAFTRHAERMSAIYAAHFDGVATDEQLLDALTGLIHGDAGASAADWAVAYELYLAALRDPALRAVTETWMRTSRSVLERFVDPVTARGVDALIEGLVMHKTLATTPVPMAEIQAIVRRALGR
ncbi:TetR/AcrR family transcriptional regulator [Actinoplanes sp. DH11]|uniref:TetR/AcrR family transcriptional regulator n=1 Tax=Actinoplanes sp. DH11 TaxID=2857011 RepID=UPI001E3D561A|nr:TetR family transcriptional regulator [Actinoplanes sp. DH11]